MQNLSFTIPCDPPRVTKQMKKTIPCGRFVKHVDTPELKEATAFYQEALLPFRPAKPFVGPLKLRVVWVFPHLASVSKKNLCELIPKDTAPDCANMEKLFVDIMQGIGFFANDGQLANEQLLKFWGPNPGITVDLEEIGGAK